MGKIALNIDDYTSAINFFNQVIDYRPNNAEAYYLRAYAKFSLEDYVGAEHDCDQAIQLHPFSEQYYSLRGLCRLNLKKYAAAASDYRRFIHNQPDDLNIRFNLAYALLKNKEFDQALNESKIIRNSHPSYEKIYLLNAEAYFEKKDSLKALEYIDTLLRYSPQNVDAWSIKGQYAYQHQNYHKADSCFTHAVAITPNNSDLHFSLALTANALDSLDKALLHYDETIRLQPNHFAAHFNRALLLTLKGDDNKAIQDYDFILNLDPKNDIARYNRALLNTNIGNYQQAIVDLTFLIQQYPNFVAAYQQRALCYNKTKQFKKAKDDESFVQKYQLDIIFAQKRYKSFSKSHQTPDSLITQANQPIANDSVDIKIFGNAVFGKIQNLKVDPQTLPPFILTITQQQLSIYQRPIYFEPLEQKTIALADILRQLNRTSPILRHQQSKYRLTMLPAGSSTQLKSIDGIQFSSNDEAYFCKAIVHTQNYQLDEALQCINNCLSQNPNDPLCLLERSAIYYLRSKQTNEKTKNSIQRDLLISSLTDINKVLELYPNEVYLLFNKSVIESALNHYQQAISSLKKALNIDPNFAEAHFNIALLLFHEGEKQQSAIHLRKAGELGIKKAYGLLKQQQIN